MRSYELVFIVQPELDENDLSAVVERVEGLIERNSGKVAKIEPWGMRRLAYPIQDKMEGQYVLMHIDLEPQGVAGLERDLRLLEPLMRHLVVRAAE
jgi:small subunit ribosomal protein S6